MNDQNPPVRIGLVAATAAGRRHAHTVAAAWPHAQLVEGETVADALRTAWAECDAVVAFLATGAVVRILAPLLADKHSDPAVVVVDEAARHAVALLGGHAGGGNDLAEQVGAVLDARPVITTATDAVGLPGLDTLGWPVQGAVAAVSRAILDGEPVQLIADAHWPLPALPPNVHPQPGTEPAAAAEPAEPASGSDAEHGVGYRLLVTDRVVPLDGRTAVLRPPSLVAGVGASRGVPAAEVAELLHRVLAEAGLSPASLRCLASADVKADEAGILSTADAIGVPLVTWPATQLAAVDVPHPSEVVRAAVGTPSVAEAAALLGSAGRPGDATLLVGKTATAMATVAVARHAPRGRLAVVGLGPGAADLRTPRAVAELRRAAVVVGLDQYLDQVRDLLRPGTRVLSSGLGAEEERARAAVAEATAGQAVALIGSGDAGVYAMASPALEYADERIDVVGVPGVTAALAAGALLGAPLGHDHAYLSLSDLHTPWEVIERRVTAAAEGDFVTLFYNPRSRARDWQLGKALGILAAHRPPDTPVGVVRNASRPGERVHLATLATLDPTVVDMYSVVVVGSSDTRLVAGRMVTPRGYRWRS
ncbi:precorrin-3B C(17)-methyltransferase [Micromonospora parathelypteridis]|uniref:Cobalt-precorrin 5A hydrolase/precorrin-3B C17-methyltransferase n=1 Tax=Micromonospora parathelypteridis TaxID=1839617 RepID=A0A840VSG8_9ACTN|nr:precorrin-3B C(17)-methyltransferase [Micromonospora parathelypteridis]MBB5475500.1 cobalt-precorrin 5A hydrolase/precorrin-3B C17-methyltransferase [Micromonospora parathelypteridis]GGO28026.1 precorrin-3B C(17)-methyltransferase [Micromonospora parathelypteridis]